MDSLSDSRLSKQCRSSSWVHLQEWREQVLLKEVERRSGDPGGTDLSSQSQSRRTLMRRDSKRRSRRPCAVMLCGFQFRPRLPCSRTQRARGSLSSGANLLGVLTPLALKAARSQGLLQNVWFALLPSSEASVTTPSTHRSLALLTPLPTYLCRGSSRTFSAQCIRPT